MAWWRHHLRRRLARMLAPETWQERTRAEQELISARAQLDEARQIIAGYVEGSRPLGALVRYLKKTDEPQS